MLDPSGRIAPAAFALVPPLIEAGIQAGVAVTGFITGAIIGDKLLDLLFRKPPADAYDKDGAKAPGKPGEAEGFVDPKAGEDWVKAPDGDWGWADLEGKVWCPTGPKGSPKAHGGPHWDVQDPRTGKHVNVYPGGKKR